MAPCTRQGGSAVASLRRREPGKGRRCLSSGDDDTQILGRERARLQIGKAQARHMNDGVQLTAYSPGFLSGIPDQIVERLDQAGEFLRHGAPESAIIRAEHGRVLQRRIQLGLEPGGAGAASGVQRLER